MAERQPGADGLATAQPPSAGLDLARGLALLGLIAAGVFHAAPGNSPSALGPMSAGDCPAVAFALVAGVSLALTSGGPRIPEGRHRTSARAELAVQAVLITPIGFALGFSRAVPVILPFYGLLHLPTMLLLGCRPWFLARVAAVVLLVAPVLVTATVDSGATHPEGNLGCSTLLTDPFGLFAALFVTGSYPVLVYLAYLCTGLAIGRTDSRRSTSPAGYWAAESPSWRSRGCGGSPCRPHVHAAGSTSFATSTASASPLWWWRPRYY